MKKLLGGILLAAGILIAGASGLCSLVVITSTGLEVIPMAALFGGIPFAVGLGLFFAGRGILRAEGNKDDAATF